MGEWRYSSTVLDLGAILIFKIYIKDCNRKVPGSNLIQTPTIVTAVFMAFLSPFSKCCDSVFNYSTNISTSFPIYY
jgi:hypothetical protein